MERDTELKRRRDRKETWTRRQTNGEKMKQKDGERERDE